MAAFLAQCTATRQFWMRQIPLQHAAQLRHNNVAVAQELDIKGHVCDGRAVDENLRHAVRYLRHDFRDG